MKAVSIKNDRILKQKKLITQSSSSIVPLGQKITIGPTGFVAEASLSRENSVQRERRITMVQQRITYLEECYRMLNTARLCSG
jgi:hypothetical protein